jgi:hypothetical protein
MQENKTKIAMILDRSGSMSTILEDAIGGYNTFINSQKEAEGECEVSLYLFDDQYDVIYESVDISEVPELTKETFVPRGMTAMYDAVGRTIATLGETLAATPEAQRPGKVLVVILTDGDENSSTEYGAFRIREMISHQRDKYQWEFLFLGANVDVDAVADSLQISKGARLQFTADSDGTGAAYSQLSRSVSRYRTSGNLSIGEPKDSAPVTPKTDVFSNTTPSD